MTSNDTLSKRGISSPKRQIVSITPDFSFLHEVDEAGGEEVSVCYQCRKCSSGCPVSFAMDYLPDVILRMVQLGLRDRVLNSSTIWICASCETCTTRCPNEIDIAGVMDTLRRMALSEGRAAPAVKDIPKFHQAFLGSIKAGGRVHEVGMMSRYMLKTNPWSRLWSGELLEQAKLGWGMFKRGKLNIRPHKIRRTGEIKKLFAKSRR
ncbi:4Fe-4S dicluster domain-containing protein [Chloroflexota bacterium]